MAKSKKAQNSTPSSKQQIIPESTFFDFSTGKILPWEISNIQTLATTQDLDFTQHAYQELRNDNLTVEDALFVILNKHVATKDLPNNKQNRTSGITFKGKTSTGVLICVKVGARVDYIVITAYQRIELSPKKRRKRDE